MSYFKREAIHYSFIVTKMVKAGHFGFWDYYDKLLLLKDCEDSINLMLCGKPSTYIINHAGPHYSG